MSRAASSRPFPRRSETCQGAPAPEEKPRAGKLRNRSCPDRQLAPTRKPVPGTAAKPAVISRGVVQVVPFHLSVVARVAGLGKFLGRRRPRERHGRVSAASDLASGRRRVRISRHDSHVNAPIQHDILCSCGVRHAPKLPSTCAEDLLCLPCLVVHRSLSIVCRDSRSGGPFAGWGVGGGALG